MAQLLPAIRRLRWLARLGIGPAASEYHLLRDPVGQLAEVAPRQHTRASLRQPANLVLDDVDEACRRRDAPAGRMPAPSSLNGLRVRHSGSRETITPSGVKRDRSAPLGRTGSATVACEASTSSMPSPSSTSNVRANGNRSHARGPYLVADPPEEVGRSRRSLPPHEMRHECGIRCDEAAEQCGDRDVAVQPSAITERERRRHRQTSPVNQRAGGAASGRLGGCISPTRRSSRLWWRPQ